MKILLITVASSGILYWMAGLGWGGSVLKEGDYRGYYNVLRGDLNHLYLYGDGKYEIWVGNTPPGTCGSWVGHGPSEGSWEVKNGSVKFYPVKEKSGLVLSLAEASASLDRNYLRISVGESTYSLMKQPASYLIDEASIVETIIE